jgi:heat shock protein HtpX
MVLALIAAVAMNLGTYWYSGDIALKMAGAREVTPAAPWLHELVWGALSSVES